MTSKKENPLPISLTISLTIPLEDGSLVRVESPRGIRYSDKDDKVYVEVAEALDVRVGNDHLFALSGEVVINPDGSYLTIRGSDAQLKMGDKSITVSKGTIHIFDDRAKVVLTGEGIIVKHKSTTLYTQKGSVTAYRTGNADREVFMRGFRIHAIVGDEYRLIASSSDRYEACAGTVNGGGFMCVGGVEYELF